VSFFLGTNTLAPVTRRATLQLRATAACASGDNFVALRELSSVRPLSSVSQVVTVAPSMQNWMWFSRAYASAAGSHAVIGNRIRSEAAQAKAHHMYMS
jgi:hypothetical protein